MMDLGGSGLGLWISRRIVNMHKVAYYTLSLHNDINLLYF